MLYLKRLPGLILMFYIIFNPLSCAHQVIDYNDRSSADVVVDDNGNDLLFTSNDGSIILYHDEVNGNSSTVGCQSRRIKSITVLHTLSVPDQTLFSEATTAKLISLDKYKPGERVKSGLFYTIVNTGNVTVDAYKITIKLPKYFEYIDIHGYNIIVPMDEKIACQLIKNANGISELHVSVNESLETDRRHRIFISGIYVIPDIKQKTDK